ncbi:MAG: hypothetical protein GF384_02350 [Elusimicrobia bacterium]|nr:hypothetical protein [Elusimicrobiota bacterium]
MNKVFRHKRCIHCGSLRTQKYGYKYHHRMYPDHARIKVVRWHCRDCKKYFIDTHAIHNISNAKDATELYFDAKASYRDVAKVLGIYNMTAYDSIQSFCQRAKMPWELSKELNPIWSGYLSIDSDTINVFGHKEYLQLGVDIGTRDVPAAILARHDDIPNWTLLLTLFKDQLHYPFKGIVSDGDSAIISTINTLLPDIPHQICVLHFEKEMFRFLRYRKDRLRVEERRATIFMNHLHDVLYARNIYDYKYELDRLINHPQLRHPDLKDAIYKLQSYYKYLTPHFFNHNIPRTNNFAENVIGQLDAKINHIVKFQSHETAWNTIKLLISWYRFKKFSCCRKRYRHLNSKSPLEIAGVNLKNTHWIYQAIRHAEPTQT